MYDDQRGDFGHVFKKLNRLSKNRVVPRDTLRCSSTFLSAA